MADKRMFNKKIVERDKFLKLTHSAQTLYLHLSLNADDEGFIDNAESVMLLSRTKREDLNNLIRSGYILQVSPDVFVITHWFLNNQIQNDRFHPTIYTDEKGLLEKPEKIWKFIGDPLYPCVDTGLDTEIDQVKKSRSNKDKSEKKNEEKKAYGIGQNVFLTDEQYQKLKASIQDIDQLIDDLSIYMGKSEANRKKYSDHYFTLLSWNRRRIADQPKPKSFSDIADDLDQPTWDIEI